MRNSVAIAITLCASSHHLQAQCESIQKTVASYEKRIRRQQNDLRKLGFATTNEDLQDWRDRSVALRDDAIRIATNAFLDVLVTAGAAGSAAAVTTPRSLHRIPLGSGLSSLNRFNANAIIKRYRDAGRGNAALFWAIEQLGHTKSKRDKLRIAGNVLHLAGIEKALYDSTQAHQTLDGLLSVTQAVAEIAGYPRVSLALSGISNGRNLAVMYARGVPTHIAIKNLNRLNEGQLQNVGRISVNLESDVRGVVNARKAHTNCERRAECDTRNTAKLAQCDCNIRPGGYVPMARVAVSLSQCLQSCGVVLESCNEQ